MGLVSPRSPAALQKLKNAAAKVRPADGVSPERSLCTVTRRLSPVYGVCPTGKLEDVRDHEITIGCYSRGKLISGAFVCLRNFVKTSVNNSQFNCPFLFPYFRQLRTCITTCTPALFAAFASSANAALTYTTNGASSSTGNTQMFYCSSPATESACTNNPEQGCTRADGGCETSLLAAFRVEGQTSQLDSSFFIAGNDCFQLRPNDCTDD